MIHSLRTIALALAAPIFFSAAFAQGDPATVQKIIDEGKNHSQAMTILDHVAHRIGARLTSSDNLERGELWAMDTFKKWGLSNVHREQWGAIPVGFQRGPNCSARMIKPFAVPMEFTSPSWSEGTAGPLRARAVAAPKTLDELSRVKGQLRGAWVIMGSRNFRRAPDPDQQKVMDGINAAAPAGLVWGSRNELCVTSGSFRNKTWEKHPKDRSVTVRKSDMDRIQRNLEKGRPVVLEFNLDQHWIKGPVKVYNVVAEIPGSEKPDEVVIVSGHFDSWDGPGSQGALDNGTGTTTAMEAARILAKVGARPKRTIRFILWTGEEQGLLGSAEYVKQHVADLPKISAVLVDDGGTDYQGGYVGYANQKDIFEQAFAPMNAAFPDMPEHFEVVDRVRPVGSDHDTFNRAGVPGFFTIETGTSDYNFVHHTQHDRYEMAIAPYLVQSGTNHAVVAYNLACADQPVPRPPASSGGSARGG